MKYLLGVVAHWQARCL